MAFVRQSFLPLKTLLNYHFAWAALLPPVIYQLPKSISENTDATPHSGHHATCWLLHDLATVFVPTVKTPTERRLICTEQPHRVSGGDERQRQWLPWSSGTSAVPAIFNSWPPGPLIVLTEASLTESLLHLIRNLQLFHLRCCHCRRPRGRS